jgi:DNA-binding transcriptional regulator YhcF (GntR family)
MSLIDDMYNDMETMSYVEKQRAGKDFVKSIVKCLASTPVKAIQGLVLSCCIVGLSTHENISENSVNLINDTTSFNLSKEKLIELCQTELGQAMKNIGIASKDEVLQTYLALYTFLIASVDGKIKDVERDRINKIILG